MRRMDKPHSRSASKLSPCSQQTISSFVHTSPVPSFVAFYASSANDAVAAIESGLQAGSLAQAAGQTALAISIMGTTAMYMIGAGQLHEAQQLTQQAMQLGTQPGELMLPEVGWPAALSSGDPARVEPTRCGTALWQKRPSRCANRLNRSHRSSIYSVGMQCCCVSLCHAESWMQACSALQQFEHIGMSMNQPISSAYAFPLHHGRSGQALAGLWGTGPCHALGRGAGSGRAAWHSLCSRTGRGGMRPYPLSQEAASSCSAATGACARREQPQASAGDM